LKLLTRRLLVLPLAAAVSVLADQVTKQAVRRNLQPGQSLSLTPGLGRVFSVTYVTNSGAAFGLFPGWSHVFVIIAVIVIVALVWYYVQLSDGQWPVQVALGLQLGGAIGNLIDRLHFAGSVVDFIDLNFWPLARWPVFNIADSSIVVGVTLLTLLMISEEWLAERGKAQLAPASDD
jgi:signal peptidase II